MNVVLVPLNLKIMQKRFDDSLISTLECQLEVKLLVRRLVMTQNSLRPPGSGTNRFRADHLRDREAQNMPQQIQSIF